MRFESHNLLLPDGRTTMPGGSFIDRSPLALAALRAAAEFAPAGPSGRPRVLDLGCREGGFAIAFADAGYDVVAVDARQTNVDRARWAVGRRGLEDSVDVVCADVRDIAELGTFDIAFCCGLLYHLDRPVAFLRELSDLTGRLLILNTHYAEARPSPTFALSEVIEHEGVRGRWYRDLEPGTTPEAMEANRGASWGNELSFWVDKRELLETLRTAGFPLVMEQYDFLESIPADAPAWLDDQSRSQFVAVKPR